MLDLDKLKRWAIRVCQDDNEDCLYEDKYPVVFMDTNVITFEVFGRNVSFDWASIDLHKLTNKNHQPLFKGKNVSKINLPESSTCSG